MSYSDAHISNNRNRAASSTPRSSVYSEDTPRQVAARHPLHTQVLNQLQIILSATRELNDRARFSISNRGQGREVNTITMESQQAFDAIMPLIGQWDEETKTNNFQQQQLAKVKTQVQSRDVLPNL